MSEQGSDTALEALYSLRGRSTTREPVYADLRRRSDVLHRRPGLLRDQVYGPTPRECLDVFTQGGNAPIFVFVHGGYWRALEKDIFLALCAPFAVRGYVAINVEYGLRPDFTVPEIVDQVLRALVFISKNAANYGGRSDRIILCGHSAGGHMVAWAATADWQAYDAGDMGIRAVVPISGIFNLEPLLQTSINNDLSLDADTARGLSPIHRLDQPIPPTLAIAGGQETQGFVDQTKDYAAALQHAGHVGEAYIAEGLDHFTICQALADPSSAVCDRVLKFIEATLTSPPHG